MLNSTFFQQDAVALAKSLLGKVLRVKYQQHWLSAQIIETEAYAIDDKASHGSLGYTEQRKALFMPAGTIYMYYSRAGDSLNISAQGDGSAVLIKSAYPYFDKLSPESTLNIMQKLNPHKNKNIPREIPQLCKGQTLLCKSLGLTIKQWNQQQFDKNKLYIEAVDYTVIKMISAKRLGIPTGKDEHLLYRFIDSKYAKYCTSNPIKKY